MKNKTGAIVQFSVSIISIFVFTFFFILTAMPKYQASLVPADTLPVVQTVTPVPADTLPVVQTATLPVAVTPQADLLQRMSTPDASGEDEDEADEADDAEDGKQQQIQSVVPKAVQPAQVTPAPTKTVVTPQAPPVAPAVAAPVKTTTTKAS